MKHIVKVTGMQRRQLQNGKLTVVSASVYTGATKLMKCYILIFNGRHPFNGWKKCMCCVKMLNGMFNLYADIYEK